MTTPKIRFKDSTSNFIKLKLNQILKRYSESNLDAEFNRDDILSLSSIHGIVDRKGLLDDTYDKVNHLAYKKCRYKDFVYGKSISASYPFGLFKVNNCKDGLLSTLYYTFKVADNVSADYLDSYFSHLNRTNNFLRGLVLVGDRYITAESEFLLSGSITIHSDKNEQQKIADFLTSVDEKINLLKKKKELLEQYKKGVMQKIFSQELKFKDDEGKDFPEWEEKELGKIGTFQTSSVDKLSRVDEDNVYLINYMNVYRHEEINNKTIQQFQIVTAKKAQIESCNLKRGDILFTPSSETPDDIGHSVVIYEDLNNAVFSYHLMRFRPSISLDIGYSHYFCNIPHVLKQLSKLATGSTRFTISVKSFSSVKVYIPQVKEQQKIADFLTALDDKIALVEQQINKTELWKKGLLQQMFV